jgi:hypothetical protein
VNIVAGTHKADVLRDTPCHLRFIGIVIDHDKLAAKKEVVSYSSK